MIRMALLSGVIVMGLQLVAVAEDEKPQPQPQPRQVQLQVRAVPAFGIARGRDPLFLLQNLKVQEELKLDDDQKTKIQGAFQDLNAARRELYQGLREVPAEERQEKLAELQKKTQEKTAEVAKSVRGLLKPEQSTRLDQISLQMRGIAALSDAEIAKKLKITDKQQQSIVQVQADQQQQRQQLSEDVRNGDVERADYRAKIQEIAKETDTKTLDVLTKEQRTEFEKMQGEKFELPAGRLQAAPFRIPIQPRKAQPKGPLPLT